MADNTVPAPAAQQAPKHRRSRSTAPAWSFKPSRRLAAEGLRIQTALCVPDDQQGHIPEDRTAPDLLPPGAPIPHVGEVICLSSSSLWVVQLVIHQWQTPTALRVEVWIEWLGSSPATRSPTVPVTQ
jgi:hypothetical protein